MVRRETVGGNPVWRDLYIQLSPLTPAQYIPASRRQFSQPLVGSTEHKGHRVSVPTRVQSHVCLLQGKCGFSSLRAWRVIK